MEAGRFDIHTDNQHRLLKLGEHKKGRTIAKNFIYQMIFQDVFGDQGMKAAGFGFAGKADFQHVFEGNQKQRAEKWTEIAQGFFDKYPGIYAHSVESIRTAVSTSRITVPSGRFYTYQPERKYAGELDWPRTKILNYPVQGFSADLVQIARLALWESLPSVVRVGVDCFLINTVHDDIEADTSNDPEVVYKVACAMEDAFSGIPTKFEKMYGSKMNTPMGGEVKFGVNLNEGSMVKFKRKTFAEDYKKYLDRFQ